jgi:hypothetical protein
MCSVTLEGRLAIRAARFGPEADVLVRGVGKKATAKESLGIRKNGGPLRGQ